MSTSRTKCEVPQRLLQWRSWRRAGGRGHCQTESVHPLSGQRIYSPASPNHHHRRRATATPNRNATNSEPRGASRAMLVKMLNGIPGLRPASIAPLIRWTVPFTASETSARVDFGSGPGSKPSWAKGASGMSSLTSLISEPTNSQSIKKREFFRYNV
jgi:hypothetical protein